MSNMSYCRFENTVGDLSDCEAALGEIMGNTDQLSESEEKAAIRLIRICHSTASDYDLDDFV